MAVRDSVKVVSRAKPHVSRRLGRIANLIGSGGARALRALERERRFLNALGFGVRRQIIRAVQEDVLEAAASSGSEIALTAMEIREIQSRINRTKTLLRRRKIKFGDEAIRRIRADGVSAKAPLMAQFAQDNMELARAAHPEVWAWTANHTACAVCLTLHGSHRQGDFNPPHPGCLCVPEKPGLVRPLTDEEIANQLIQRGGRDARLGRALRSGQIGRGELRVRRNGIIKQRNFRVPDVTGPTAHYRNADFLNFVGSAKADEFYDGFARAKQGKYGGFLSDLDQSFFEGDNVRVYTAFDGKVGAALTYHDDGRIEVGSLFADPDAPSGAGRDMLRYLVREHDVNYLTNFDGPLTEFYIEEGFQVISRSPFNPDFAPEGWNYDLFGTPDYVEMAKT